MGRARQPAPASSGPALRPPRQAASARDLARRPRPLRARPRGRRPLRPRHRRRRLLGLCRSRSLTAHSTSPASITGAASCSSRRARRAAARISAPTSSCWHRVLVRTGPRSSSASTPDAPPMTGSGSRPRCGGCSPTEIRVDVLSEGVHSGSAGGVVPSSFRLLRQLLSRIEDEDTGAILVAECHAEAPAGRRREAEELVAALGEGALDGFPTVPGLRLEGDDPVDRILRRTWAPALAFVGMDGVPAVRRRRQRAPPVHDRQDRHAVATECRRRSGRRPRRCSCSPTTRRAGRR